ncbi:serine protease [Streptomyces sp. TRM64462]|uniref:trypsin-like serine peptidase n=1 Tax=Streptomyces sp. TRM64462 TaxID=2741726 RepID=UPI001586B7A9|nr:trypsin-like serine protease [Streptomyces sp. TRM64462]
MHHHSPLRRLVRSAAVLCAVSTLSVATACTAGPVRPAPRPPGGTAGAPSAAPSAEEFDALPSVGVLRDGDDHWCTASVVDSPRGDVVATAAHCVDGYTDGDEDALRGLRFVPGFHGAGGGTAPYGTWRVKAVRVDDAWRDDGDDAHDFAFLTLEPDDAGRPVQRVVGAAAPDWSSPPHRRVTVVGYPNEDHNPANRPIGCTTEAATDPDVAGWIRMECGGFYDGTSGSPWLADYRDPAHPGRVIAVLSGGDTDDVSTAALFGPNARKLYDEAVAAG